MGNTPTMKVKPWGEGQGEYVIINVEDFNPEKHTPVEVDDDAVEVTTVDAKEMGFVPTRKPKKKTKRKAKR